MEKFDLRKYLTENRLTKQAKQLSEGKYITDMLPNSYRSIIKRVMRDHGIENYTVDRGKDYGETVDDYILKFFDTDRNTLDSVEDDLKRSDVIVVSANMSIMGDGIITFDV